MATPLQKRKSGVLPVIWTITDERWLILEPVLLEDAPPRATFLTLVASAKTPPLANTSKANRVAGWWNARWAGCQTAAPCSSVMTRTASILPLGLIPLDWA